MGVKLAANSGSDVSESNDTDRIGAIERDPSIPTPPPRTACTCGTLSYGLLYLCPAARDPVSGSDGDDVQ
ncbi:hypothetical protein D8S78_15355 [Natrialba swarupiae]|nr:hypothetical protein [Natrialba swarupiae]